VTQQMYDNLKSFVENGGVLVAMDGNVFFCEVSYDKAAQTVSWKLGHFWQAGLSPDGKRKLPILGPGERWQTETSLWFGSNSDAAPDIQDYSFLGTVLGYDPFGYPQPKGNPQPQGNSGIENQYVSNSLDMIILDYKPYLIDPFNQHDVMKGWPKQIATYTLDYKKGRSLIFGLFTDVVQTNPTFLKFFDKVFDEYAILRSTLPLAKEFIPPHNPRVEPASLLPMSVGPVDPNDPKQVLEERIREHMTSSAASRRD
jgi:hypothetical protein